MNEEKNERKQYLDGLKRYRERGIPIYMDGQISNPKDWERLFEVREDGMFYMGDYVQADAGGLKEIRFDKVYASEEDVRPEKVPRKEKNRRR